MGGHSTLKAIGRVAAIVLIGILFLFPLYWMVTMSFKPQTEWNPIGKTIWWPQNPTLDNYKQVLGLILVRQEMGRPFAMPANVPADRVAILRAAFEATLKDPAFIADAQKLQMEIDPLTGAQIQDLLKTAYATPRTIVQRAAQFVR